MGLLPLFDPPRHDSAETIRRALNLGVNVKMITGMYKKNDLANAFSNSCNSLIHVKFFETRRGSTCHCQGNRA